MKSSVQCIVLLACVAICSSAPIKNCQCVKTSQAVKPSLILEVRVLKPRPYCSKLEVIVILKDKISRRCLDPQSPFTEAVLQSIQAKRAKMSTTALKTTTTATTTSAAMTP